MHTTILEVFNMMSTRPSVRRSFRTLIAFAAVGLFACSDSTAPLASTDDLRLERDLLGSGAPAFADAPVGAVAAPPVISFAEGALPLSTYDTSFVVVVGKASTHQIMFRGTSLAFLKLEIPTSAVFFDAKGNAVKPGNKVKVTTQVDRVNAAVRFGPHGTLFSTVNPAKVSLNYSALDLAGLQPQDLSVWYQPNDLTAWDRQATRLDVQGWWIGANIFHFSNYAVAY